MGIMYLFWYRFEYYLTALCKLNFIDVDFLVLVRIIIYPVLDVLHIIIDLKIKSSVIWIRLCHRGNTRSRLGSYVDL